MTEPVYVGIENEFQIMDTSTQSYRQLTSGPDFFWRDLLKRYKQPHFRKSPTSIRTRVGSGIYIDGEDPEVCTPPVRVEQGFATKAAAALYAGRKELLDLLSSEPAARLVGFSTHWNISVPSIDNGSADSSSHMKSYVVPYSLFTLNPLSVGTNLRLKQNNRQDGPVVRWELLGDYIEDMDQIISFLLLYAASVFSTGNGGKMPLQSGEFPLIDLKYAHPVLDGRHTKVTAFLHGTFTTITAQTYLELTYDYLKPVILKLGTPEEVATLEDFVQGKRTLDMDRFRRFAVQYSYKGADLKLAYDPLFCLDAKAYAEEKKLPPLAAFLGSVVEQQRVHEMSSWDAITISDASGRAISLLSLPAMDVIAETLPRLKPVQQKRLVSALTDQYDSVVHEDILELPNSLATDVTIPQRDRKVLSKELSRAVRAVFEPAVSLKSPLSFPIRNLDDFIEHEHPPYDSSADASLPEGYSPSDSQRQVSWRRAWHASKLSRSNYLAVGVVGAVAALVIGVISYIDYIHPTVLAEQKKVETTSAPGDVNK
ncbi:MAG: hypothetical protein Q7R76_00225 [Candidatus Woesearchaeota archaeon]|nr:hypothetical protein [Candidatus Woesearchaeota archaeon]